MSTHERTLAVIQHLYDAAMDESLWSAALKELTALMESQAASFWVLDGSETPRLPTFIYINFDLDSVRDYLDHMAALDPTVQYLVNHPRQPIVHDGLVITEREKRKHPYYDWHNRHIETRFRMVAQTRLTHKIQAGVALHRTQEAGKYEPKEIERFALLHRHIERALAISFRLGSLGAMQQLTTEWLDHSPAAILFLNKHKHVVFANRRAQEFRSGIDGVKLCADGIFLERKQDNDKLQGIIAQALSPLVSGGTVSSGAMRAERPTGKRPYGILISRVSDAYPVLSEFRPAVCVVVTDPDFPTHLPTQQLRAAFGLTEAEARLAVLLAAGEELRSAANKLEITYGTARTRLTGIFQKTETQRQGELIVLLLRTLAPK